MKKILGIEVTDAEFNYLFSQQSKGLELHVENGKVVAREHIVTEEEKKEMRISEINARLTSLTQDFVQAECGEIIEDIDVRRAEFVTLHNELRVLLGKEPRETIKTENNISIDILEEEN